MDGAKQGVLCFEIVFRQGAAVLYAQLSVSVLWDRARGATPARRPCLARCVRGGEGLALSPEFSVRWGFDPPSAVLLEPADIFVALHPLEVILGHGCPFTTGGVATLVRFDPKGDEPQVAFHQQDGALPRVG